MIKKILIIIGVILVITSLALTYSSIGLFVVGSSQPKIISTDGHNTYSWGFYTVGIVFVCITVFSYLVTIIYIIVAIKKYNKHYKNKNM